MASLADRLLTASGRPSSLKRPSVPLSSYGTGSLTMIDGQPVSYQRLYEAQPWVYRGVRALGEQIARLPLKAYRTAGDGRERLDPAHPLARLLTQPSAGLSPLELRWRIATGLLVHGNRVAEKVRPSVGAPPSRLWPLDWRHLRPVLEDGTVLAWEHRPPTGPVRLLAAGDVVHWRWQCPDGDLGVSPLAPLGVTVRSEDAAQRYADAMLRNGARVGVAAMLDDRVAADDPAIAEVIRALDADHAGPDKANRPVALSGAVKDLREIPSQTAVEAELIDQRRVNREEIAAVYGVPQPIAGILDHGTFSNFEEAHRMLYTTVLGPWLELVQAQIEAQLVEAEPAWAGQGIYVEFDLGEVLKGEPRERMAAYRDALAAGALTINDIRRLENRPAFPDPAADEPLVAANNLAPLSMLPTVAAGRGATPDAAAVEKALAAALAAAGVNGHSADIARTAVQEALGA